MLDKKLEDLYKEYIDLLKSGLSADKALARFDYIHPITRARLLKVIRNYESKFRLAK